MADVSATKSGSSDREIWLSCFSSALTGLLSGNQAVAYEPEQVIRQAGKLADIALTKVQVRHSLGEAEDPRTARTPGLGTPAAALLGERGAAAAAAPRREGTLRWRRARPGGVRTAPDADAIVRVPVLRVGLPGGHGAPVHGGRRRLYSDAGQRVVERTDPRFPQGARSCDEPQRRRPAVRGDLGRVEIEVVPDQARLDQLPSRGRPLGAAIFLEKQSKTVAAQVKPQPAATPSKETRTEPRVSSSTATAGASRR